MTVGFQGEAGAFSESAAQALLGEAIETRGYPTFDALLGALASGEIERALLPRENAIAGIIAEADAVLARYPSVVEMRDITHPIEQCLIALPGATIESLVRAYSHPVALAQCARFFAAHPFIEAIAADDTAASVRRIMETADPTSAAIASAAAAQRYSAVILARGIGDRADNSTRFTLLARAARA